jgi:hypothetical protein
MTDRLPFTRWLGDPFYSRTGGTAPEGVGEAEGAAEGVAVGAGELFDWYSPSLRRVLLVELPLPAFFHEAPDDDEARRAGVVHEGDVSLTPDLRYLRRRIA